jgi:integrase
MRIGEALGLQITYYDRQILRNLKGDIYYRNNAWCINIVFRGSNPIDSLAKGHRGRKLYIEISDTLTFEKYLKRYLEFRDRKTKQKKNPWFLINNRGKKLTQNTAYVRFKRNLEKTLPQLTKDFTLHTWRHTYCTNALLEGVRLEIVSKRAGHKSPLTTFLIYVHNTREDMLDIRKKYDHYIEPALKYLQRRTNKWTT